MSPRDVRFHAPVVEPSDWMLVGVGAGHAVDGVQFRALYGRDGKIDVGVVGAAEPDFDRLLFMLLRHTGYQDIPAFCSGLILSHPDDRADWQSQDLPDGKVVPVVADAACSPYAHWERIARCYLQRKARPVRGQIRARWAFDGIDVQASPDLDGEGAAAVLVRLAEHREHEARQPALPADWPSDPFVAPWVWLEVGDNAEAVLSIGSGWRRRSQYPEGAPVVPVAELIRAVIVYTGENF